MNKFVLSLVIVAVLAVALGTTGVAFAQGQVPPTPQNPGSSWGAGTMGGRGVRGGMMGTRAAGSQTGFLHEEMVAAFAEELGLSVDELKARLAEGETIAQIAFSQGMTTDQFLALKAEARAQALDQAVEDGKLTQAQADWMKQRAGHGAGQGRLANPDCPYYNQTSP